MNFFNQTQHAVVWYSQAFYFSDDLMKQQKANNEIMKSLQIKKTDL